MSPTPDQLKMIDTFQCPGCVCGLNTGNCEVSKFSLIEFGSGSGLRCVGHAPGTNIGGVVSGLLYLGMPKGFNRVGLRYIQDSKTDEEKTASRIRLFIAPDNPGWNKFNVPVWAMVKDGHLFVRTMCPRINFTWVDVVKGGDLSMCPQALDVGNFEMD